MAGRKQTTKADSGKSEQNKKTKKNEKSEQFEFLNSEIMIIALFFIAIVLFLSHFGLIGALGKYLKIVQLGLFGILGYALPMLIFIGGAFLISNPGSSLAKIKFTGVFLAILSIDALLSLILIPDLKKFGLLRFFTEGWYGGFIGGGLGLMLQSAFGKVGAIIFFIALFIISIVILTGKSFVSFVKAGGQKTISKAKSDMERMMERRKLKKQEELSEYEYPKDDDYGDEFLEQSPKFSKGLINLGAIDFSKKKVKHVVNLPSIREESKTEESVNGVFENQSNVEFKNGEGFDNYYQRNQAASENEAGYEKKRSDVFYGNINRGSENVKYEDDIDEDTLRRANEILARKDEVNIYENTPSTIRITEDGTGEDFGYYDVPETVQNDSGIEFLNVNEDYNVTTDNGWNDAGIEIPNYSDNNIKTEGGNLSKNSLKTEDKERTLITAGGKVIVSDTEALQKKMEEARANTPNAKINREIGSQKTKPYTFPSTGLLRQSSHDNEEMSDNEYKNTAITLQETLASFDVNVTVEDISVGPSVTLYELKPEQGVKVSKVLSLANDIKLALAASDIRIEAPIPGKSAIGIEVPNKKKQMVYLRDLFESRAFRNGNESIGFAVGKDISGNVIVSDIAKMPHVLIAGATGSGKSVCINTLIMSIIYKYSPEDVKLIMVDPKVVELSVYNGIPHLLIPVVTEPKKAASALNWAVAEMGDRYSKFAATGVRDISSYNKRIDDVKRMGDASGLPQKLPKIVIIIDELADLMMVANNEVEDSIVRLAQLARACGIHLVIATQRPSVNVITGIIKANIPSRIAFAVSSGTDSRTILDGNGAEKLLGKGDMLFVPYGSPNPIRIQGAFVSDEEVQRVVDFLKNQGMTARYDEDTIKTIEDSERNAASAGEAAERDELFEAAGRYILEKDKASIGNLQRNFKIGFNRAARIMDQLASAGVVGDEAGTKRREILMNLDEFQDIL